jgi:outer membrane protein assembly factor BamB
LVRIDGATLSVDWRVHLREKGGVQAAADGAVVVANNGVCSGYRTTDGGYLWGPADGYRGCFAWGDALYAETPLAIIEPDSGVLERTLWRWGDIGAVTIHNDVALGRGLGGGILNAFDLREERPLWSRDLLPALREALRGTLYSIQGVGDERVLASTLDRVVVVDPAGAVVWRRDVELESAPTIGPKNLFFLAAGRGRPPHMVALDLATGETAFDVPAETVGALERPFAGTLDGDQVAFGTNQGLVISFDAISGEEKWSYRHTSATLSPVFDLGWAFCSTGDGSLLIFDAGGSAN